MTLGLAVLVLTAGDCDDDLVDAPIIGSITLDPGAATLSVGLTAQLEATVLSTDGDPLPDEPVTVLDFAGNPVVDPMVNFTSSDETIATVDADGLITAQAEGDAVITAETDGLTAEVAVTVEPIPVGEVVVEPAEVTVAVGATAQLTATVLNEGGVEIPGAVVTWSSDDEAVATVDDTGLVSGVAAGSAVITAESGGVQGTAAVTVE